MSGKKESDDCPSEEASSQAESFDTSKSGTSETYDVKDFCPGIRIEAKDFDGKWYPAKVSDVDWTENEILVHFENWNAKFDEWIPMDSSRLRPIQKPVIQQRDTVKFSKGEEVMAVWSANQKYPGIIQAVLANDRYDVLFSDGFLKRLKGHKISKLEEGTVKPEVKTFTDIGTKEERRERKRKINVAELFHINKRSKKKGLVSSKSSDIKTYPVCKSRPKGSIIKKTEGTEESKEGAPPVDTKGVKQTEEKPAVVGSPAINKASIDNIPAAFEVKYLNGQTETWSKQLYQRSEGRTAGKLDIVILNPQGRKFRSRNEIMKYCEENGIIYSHEAFDFSAKGRPKSKSVVQSPVLKTEISAEEKDKGSLKKGAKKVQSDLLLGSQNLDLVSPQNEVLALEGGTPSKVFIGEYEVVIENGKFICPVKICGKHFRRENLLHMHMKHYHPEFSKYLDYTPSVTDLAYARTVGNLDAVEIQPPPPRKLSAPEKPEKSATKVENFRRVSDISDSKEAKKLKTSDSKLDSKTTPVKPSTDVSTSSSTVAEEPAEDTQKNKTGLTSLSAGRTNTSLNETETKFRENPESSLNEGSTEQSSRNCDSNVTLSVPKPSRHSKLHSKKKSSRFQGSFSEHLRKRRFLSQDRSRSHNRVGRQQQPQLPGQQFPSIQPSQTTVSPLPSVEETNSNGPSQGQTVARYLKPHLNISNEISGKNTLLTNYKTLSPVTEGKEKCSETNTWDKAIKVRKKGQTIRNRRSFLAGLLNARKRKGKAIRKRWRKKKRERLKSSVQLSDALKENKSGHIEDVKKPDTNQEESYSYNCSIVNSLKTDDESQIPSPKESLKLKIKRLSSDNMTNANSAEQSYQTKPVDILPDSSGSVQESNSSTNSEMSDKKDSSVVADNANNSPPKIKPSDLPRAYVLLENVCRKENIFKDKSTFQKGNENVKNCPKSSTHQKGGKKRKRFKGQNSTKKVRFENSVLEKWIDGSEAFDKSEAVGREDRKNRQRKLHLNDYLNENETSQRSDDCSRDEKSIPNKKTRGLDQTEVNEDSKSPVAVENDKVEKLRRNEIINCLCGVTEEDGLMIQCDICLCWQHGHCAGILREMDVPDKYTCAICKNPFRGRSSMKYLHDQEWLKEGTLPSLSFRSKRNDIIDQRKTILKRSHDLSGSISLLAQVIHSLRIKVNIAEKKDHPKLWLWAKKWTEKKPNRLKEESEIKEERSEEPNVDLGNAIKKEEVSDEKNLPKAPEPEAPIDSAECRLNLLDHLIHYQSLVDDRLSCIESLVAELESMQDDAVNDETPDRYPRTKATIQMILRDLNTMKKIPTI